MSRGQSLRFSSERPRRACGCALASPSKYVFVRSTRVTVTLGAGQAQLLQQPRRAELLGGPQGDLLDADAAGPRLLQRIHVDALAACVPVIAGQEVRSSGLEARVSVGAGTLSPRRAKPR